MEHQYKKFFEGEAHRLGITVDEVLEIAAAIFSETPIKAINEINTKYSIVGRKMHRKPLTMRSEDMKSSDWVWEGDKNE